MMYNYSILMITEDDKHIISLSSDGKELKSCEFDNIDDALHFYKMLFDGSGTLTKQYIDESFIGIDINKIQ